MHQRQSERAGKRTEHATRGPTQVLWQVLHLESLHQWTRHRPKERATPEALQSSKLKYILNSAPSCLRKSRENTKAGKKKFTFATFCPDCPKICHDWSRKGRRRENAVRYVESIRKGTPPPFRERQEPLAPIIFRTKNTEKSHLGLIGKNFGKNLWENVSGEEKAPNLVERGRGAKI